MLYGTQGMNSQSASLLEPSQGSDQWGKEEK